MAPDLSPNCLKQISAIIQKGLSSKKKGLSSKKMRLEDNVIRFVPVTIMAKIVRAILKDLYPYTNFCVRSKQYAGGSSVSVYYLENEAD